MKSIAGKTVPFIPQKVKAKNKCAETFLVEVSSHTKKKQVEVVRGAKNK